MHKQRFLPMACGLLCPGGRWSSNGSRTPALAACGVRWTRTCHEGPGPRAAVCSVQQAAAKGPH